MAGPTVHAVVAHIWRPSIILGRPFIEIFERRTRGVQIPGSEIGKAFGANRTQGHTKMDDPVGPALRDILPQPCEVIMCDSDNAAQSAQFDTGVASTHLESLEE